MMMKVIAVVALVAMPWTGLFLATHSPLAAEACVPERWPVLPSCRKGGETISAADSRTSTKDSVEAEVEVLRHGFTAGDYRTPATDAMELWWKVCRPPPDANQVGPLTEEQQLDRFRCAIGRYR